MALYERLYETGLTVSRDLLCRQHGGMPLWCLLSEISHPALAVTFKQLPMSMNTRDARKHVLNRSDLCVCRKGVAHCF
jgi:hypothetical protein